MEHQPYVSSHYSHEPQIEHRPMISRRSSFATSQNKDESGYNREVASSFNSQNEPGLSYLDVVQEPQSDSVDIVMEDFLSGRDFEVAPAAEESPHDAIGRIVRADPLSKATKISPKNVKIKSKGDVMAVEDIRALAARREEAKRRIFLMVNRLYLPNLNKTSKLYFGNEFVPVSSPYLHRVLRTYYYSVAKLSLRKRNRQEQLAFYRMFNKHMIGVVEKVIAIRSRTDDCTIRAGNYQLKCLLSKLKLYNASPYPPKQMPYYENNVAGVCVKCVAFSTYPLLKPQVPKLLRVRFRVNAGALNQPDPVSWTTSNCSLFFEKAYKYQIPYDDDMGVNIMPPTIKSQDAVWIRGPRLYTRKELFDNGTLLRFYRCEMLKITSVPLETERDCYFHEFHKKFLAVIKDLYLVCNFPLPPSYRRIENWLKQKHKKSDPLYIWDNDHMKIMSDVVDLLNRKEDALDKPPAKIVPEVVGKTAVSGPTMKSCDIGVGRKQEKSGGLSSSKRKLLFSVLLVLLLLLVIVTGIYLIAALIKKKHMRPVYSGYLDSNWEQRREPKKSSRTTICSSER